MVKIITKKISKNEAIKLYNNSIKPDVNALSNVPGKGKCKKINMLNVLDNIKSSFDGFYLHYKDVPKETVYERSIAERSKLRGERTSEIKKRR